MRMGHGLFLEFHYLPYQIPTQTMLIRNHGYCYLWTMWLMEVTMIIFQKIHLQS